LSQVILIPSILGIRPAIEFNANRLRRAGHTVHVLDMFEGEAPKDEYAGAVARIEEIGFDGLAARARLGVASLPTDAIYIGYSAAASFAAAIAGRRPGALGAVLLSGGSPPKSLGLETWPSGVPVQMHATVDDGWMDPQALSTLPEFIRAAGATCDVFPYPGSSHLFDDPGLISEYRADSAELMWSRVLEFVARVGTAGAAARS
jgi:dienelactone hydrolase